MTEDYKLPEFGGKRAGEREMATPRRSARVDEVKDTILKIQKNLQCPIW